MANLPSTPTEVEQLYARHLRECAHEVQRLSECGFNAQKIAEALQDKAAFMTAIARVRPENRREWLYRRRLAKLKA